MDLRSDLRRNRICCQRLTFHVLETKGGLPGSMLTELLFVPEALMTLLTPGQIIMFVMLYSRGGSAQDMH